MAARSRRGRGQHEVTPERGGDRKQRSQVDEPRSFASTLERKWEEAWYAARRADLR